jgi:hypothetical protein
MRIIVGKKAIGSIVIASAFSLWLISMKCLPTEVNMTDQEAISQTAILVSEYRDRCLWFLDERFLPTTADEALRALELIERYGDMRAFQRAGELRQWLLQSTSPKS